MAIRLSGLSSGMDTEKMVQDLMKVQRMSYNSISKKKVQMEWKKADYYKLYAEIKKFKEETVFSYKLESTVISRKATSNNQDVVTATANASAANMNHTINVTQLADGASMTSSASVSVGDKTKLSTQLGIAEGIVDVTIKNGPGPSDTKTIQVDTSKSIYTLVSQINNAGVNVKANYDATLDRFFLSTTNQGATAEIDLSSSSVDGQALLGKLNIDPSTVVTGKNAIFDLDTVVGLEQSSNIFTISDVTYSLKDLGSTTVNVTSDTEKAIENVKTFVKAYNELLAKINSELKEPRYKGYLPLTDEEKGDLKESQILVYEDKARSGMLRQDSTLSGLVYKMRNDVAASVSGITGSYTSFSAIGITTSPNYREGGTLYVDEIKLRAALEADPEVLGKLFTTDDGDEDTSSGDGVATRLYNTLKNSMDKLTTEAGFTASASGDEVSNLAKKIHGYDKQLTNMNRRLKDIEDRYYRQFDAMEKALSKLNSQGAWLSQQTGG